MRCLALSLSLLLAATGVDGAFSFMSYYGVDVPKQVGWVNLPVVTAFTDADAFYAQGNGTQSMLRMPSQNIYQRPPKGTSHEQSSQLLPGWRSALTGWVAANLTPRLHNQTSAGVFIGDEICCHNASCLGSTLAPITQTLRSLVGPSALLYLNECGDTVTGLPKTAGALLPDLDLFGVDIYRYGPAHKAGDEAAAVREFAESDIFPRFRPTQRFMAVPGTFTCSNESYSPAAAEDTRVAAELGFYVSWAKAEPRVAGLNPWHFKNRTSPQHSPPCNMEVGAEGMPKTLATLQALRPGQTNQ